MASNARFHALRAFAPIVALALLLAACSAGGAGSADPKLPDPQMGRAATFDLAKLSTKYDVNDAVTGDLNSFVASDRWGNVYMMNGVGTSFDVLRMTPQGKVSRFTQIAYMAAASGMATTPDGGLLIGGASGLIRVDRHGTAVPIRPDHHFAYPNPIGARSDGSVILLDEGRVWSLKNGKVIRLYGKPGDGGGIGAVDASGTAYVKLTSGKFTDVIVLPPGKAPTRLQISGQLPGSHTPISGLTPLTLTTAPGGGFYAMANSEATKAEYVVHVRGVTATVLAQNAISDKSPDHGCLVGKQYPAFNIPCIVPWFVVQIGDRVLVMGSRRSLGGPQLPALVIGTDSK